MAAKTKDFNVADYNFSEDKTITITKKHTALRIDNMTQEQAQSATYKIQDGKLLITSGGHTLTVENYEGIKYIKTDFKQINKKKSTFNLYDLITNGKIDNYSNPITDVNAKKLTISSTIYNDLIDATSANNTLTKTVKKQALAKVSTDAGIKINGGLGDDIITGTMYSDTITGGKGKNTINFVAVTDTVEGTTSFGNDIVNLTKGEKLNIFLYDTDGITILTPTYERAKNAKGKFTNDLLIKTDKGTVTLKNYYAKETGAEVKINGIDLAKTAKFDFTETNLDKKGAITTSALADNITINLGNPIKSTYNKKTGITTEYGATINSGAGDDVITGSNYIDTIKSGNGNDTINGSLGTDSITGGAGENTINYTDINQLDGDKITLTKNETLNIDVKGITTNPDNITYKVSGKNLVVTVTNGTDTKSFTINNFGTKDITTSNGAVKVFYGSGENDYIDLRTTLLDELKITKNYTGTFHADNINAENYNLYTDKKKTNVDYVNLNKKGLTINGGAGSDIITGSRYSDTIKAGTGTGDIIEGGTGNDKLYASTTKGSSTTFNFKAGDGKDTVYSGKGEDTLKFYDINLDTIKFEQGTKKNNKDLIIKYSDNDAVTVKNYYTVNKKGKITGINKNNTIKNIIGNGTNFIIGSELSETIDGTSGKDIIYANGGDDVINASAGDDIIYIGSGNSTVKVDMSILTGEVQQEGTEYEWVDYKENCVKTIYLQNDSVLTLDFDKEIFDNGCGIFCRGSGQDNNLYISLSNSVEPAYGIVIKDYFDEKGNPRTDDVKLSIWDGEETPTIYTVPEWANANLIPWVRTFDVQPFGEYTGEIRGTNMPNETLLYSAGFGDDTIYGGNGNKENIYLHGGSDTVHANEGTKNISIWGNQTDVELYLGSKETTKTNIHLGLVEGNVTSTINEAGDLNVSWDCYADSTEDTYTSTLRVDNWNNRTSEATISIGGNNRDNTLQAIDGVNNTLDGGDGDDILIGGDGIDTFNFTYNSEYGIDTVKNYTSDDILQFESASSFPVDFSKFKYYTNNNGKGLVINTTDLYNKESYVIIDNYFETDNKIDKVTTYNWSNPDEEKSLATMYGDKSSLGSFDLGADGVYAGTDNVDVFIAKSGTNTYTGGKGSDTLTSNDGENTFVFNSGDGSDTLYQKGGNITLKFNDATIEELSSKTGYDRDASGYVSDLLIHYDGENTLRVKDYFYKNYVTKIIDSTGTEYNMTDYFKRVEYIDSIGADYMRQYSSKDEELRITAKVYRAEGKGGSDIILGSDYDEELYTYKADNYSFTTFDKTEGVVDKIHAGGGDDILVGNSSTNYLYGDEGNDTFIVFASEGLNTFVSDSLGTADSMNIYDETYDKLHFVFNIDKDGNMDSNGLRILNDENFNLWKANISDTNIKGINITEWNCVENFEEAGDGNGCSHLTISTIETVKNEIASWLTSEGYTDVSDVFANEKTEGDITTLIGKFDITDKWQYEAY